ncbi:hypothetical protein MOO45_04590 [Bombilactobacillus folatiphilus]|uniref:Uncharacterized protein n=1 Tax=Bombilactobacillus folatiphilus TaxID=2923362 RepID=A0ABY4P7D4_9LACO|nr:hypothetical protein [Bombilactobacillus folatiphilus]UQS81506.1 hypothetical protein MOO45_04590 [Bombilactobacillus folatiphilus]
MKRTIILNFLIAVLLIFAGFAVSHNDMRNYHNLMDRGNIQENALIYPTKSHQSIPGVLRKFEKANLKKYQIYFIQKKILT